MYPDSRLVRSLILLSAVIALSSCATIVSKTRYPVHIRTTPIGATVVVTDKKNREVFRGKTPTSVALKSGAGFFTKAAYEVKLSAPGYEEKTVPVKFTINGWYFGNIFFGGVIGMLIIDPATGAMWTIKDMLVDEALDKSAAISSAEPSLNIININDLSAEQKAKLVKL